MILKLRQKKENCIPANSINMLKIWFSRKNTDITPVFKKGDGNLKDNYGPVNILSNISKVL